MQRILQQLHGLRREFGPAAARRRRSLLTRAAARSCSSAAAIRGYHEELLFLAAYPDDAALRAFVQRELRRVAGHARSSAARGELGDSGIAGTQIAHSFTLEMLDWLHRRPGGRVELVWEAGSLGEDLDELLPALVLTPERDGLLDKSLTTREWLRRADPRRRDALGWLIQRLSSLGGPLLARDRLIESLGLTVRWRPARGDSRTFARFPSRPLFAQREPLLRRVDLSELLRRPLPRSAAPLAGAQAHALIDVCRAALAVRQRETDPVTWADPREVWLLRLERGVDVAVLGMTPQRRLPIESFFGYVAARNRVPIAYGGGWVFFDRCEIGVNLFDTFRGGESAYIFAQVLRVYRQLFHVRRFQVDPYQIGAENDEAIQSGAFWFYYRLGFRPEQAALRRLAARQDERLRAQPGYRSPPRVLRELAGSRLVLDEVASKGANTSQPGAAPQKEPRGRAAAAPELTQIGLAVTRWIARRFGGDRERALRWSLETLARWSTAAGREWTAAACPCLGLAPLAAMIPDLARWTPAERSALFAILSAKGGPRERDYVLATQEHSRYREALTRIATAT